MRGYIVYLRCQERIHNNEWSRAVIAPSAQAAEQAVLDHYADRPDWNIRITGTLAVNLRPAQVTRQPYKGENRTFPALAAFAGGYLLYVPQNNGNGNGSGILNGATPYVARCGVTKHPDRYFAAIWGEDHEVRFVE